MVCLGVHRMHADGSMQDSRLVTSRRLPGLEGGAVTQGRSSRRRRWEEEEVEEVIATAIEVLLVAVAVA